MVNLDICNPYGKPAVEVLKNARIGAVRLEFVMSYLPQTDSYGNTNLAASAANYTPYINALHAAGIKVVLVLTHRTYGEGQGYDWTQMMFNAVDTRWEVLIDHLAHYAQQIAQLYRGKIWRWSVWNEQDTPIDKARAAVPVPAPVYGQMYTRVRQAIRSVDPAAVVGTGGLMSGPGAATKYLKAAQIDPDVVMLHEYGRGSQLNPNYRPFGTIEESLTIWRQYTQRPILISEFGVLDQPHEPVEKVAAYARDFLIVVRGKVEAALWYSWSDHMDNGYGVTDKNGTIKLPLVTALGGTMTTVSHFAPGRYMVELPTGVVLNFRSKAGTSQPVVAKLLNGMGITINGDSPVWIDNFWWYPATTGAFTGYFARIPELNLTPINATDQKAVLQELAREVTLLAEQIRLMVDLL